MIRFATSNRGKFLSARDIFDEYGLEIGWLNISIPEPRGTLEEIALKKLEWVRQRHDGKVFVVDSGFYIDAWNGFPGPYTNFALRTIGIDGILKIVEGMEKSCSFRNVLAYWDGTREWVFRSEIPGRIGSPDGTKSKRFWSDLFFIFIPDGKDKTLASMSEEEYREFVKESEETGIFRQLAEHLAKEGEAVD